MKSNSQLMWINRIEFEHRQQVCSLLLKPRCFERTVELVWAAGGTTTGTIVTFRTL